MELEERSIEELPERCESCGATLTRTEKQRVLDDGSSTALCTTCAADTIAIGDEDSEDDATY
jgi:hypothetical protein